MKYLLLLLIPLTAYAGNWKSQKGLEDAHAKKPNRTYWLKKTCEEKEKAVCINMDNYDWEVTNYGPHDVDDPTRPIFSTDPADRQLTTPCSGNCDAIAESLKAACRSFPDHAIEKTPTEVSCKLVTGYEQKSVTGLYIDDALVTQKLARLAAEQAKRDVDTQREQRLKTAKEDFNTLTPVQKDAVLKDILEKVAR